MMTLHDAPLIFLLSTDTISVKHSLRRHPSNFPVVCAKALGKLSRTRGTATTVFRCVKWTTDRHLTTFITQFGKWRHTRTSQGFLSSRNSYNRRVNAILSDFLRNERCADDTIFCDENLDEHRWQPIQFLTLAGRAGIVLNPDKF